MKPLTMKHYNIIRFIVGLVVVVTLFILGRQPESRNSFTALIPFLNEAKEPEHGIAQSKSETESGSMLTNDRTEIYNKGEINETIAAFHTPDQYMDAQYDVELYTITFNTTDQDNKLLAVTGQLYLPKINESEEFPVMVYAAGTTGLDDTCAPSKEITDVDNWGNYNAQMLSYASQGYIVFFPDYEGFNDLGRIHHYLVAQLESRVLLDGARATYDFFTKETVKIKPKQAVFLAGYSQGGHAIFGAKDIAKEYAPDVPLAGIIGHAPTTNVQALLLENPRLAPYLMVSYSDLYGIDTVAANRVLQPQWVANLEADAKSKCISQVITDYPNDPFAMYTTEFYDGLLTGLGKQFPQLKKLFDANSTGYRESAIPALVFQGTIDPIVQATTQEKFIQQSCAQGNKIQYRLYEGVDHYQTRQVSFKETLQWMSDRLQNKELTACL